MTLSTAKAEYIAAGPCSQILWIVQQLRDLRVDLKAIPIKCDNTSAIYITKNLVQHSRTKHIEVRYHFIRDHVERGNITLFFIPTKNQLADIFTKLLSPNRFAYIRMELEMLNDVA